MQRALGTWRRMGCNLPTEVRKGFTKEVVMDGARLCRMICDKREEKHSRKREEEWQGSTKKHSLLGLPKVLVSGANWKRSGRWGQIVGGASVKHRICLYKKFTLEFKDNGKTANALEYWHYTGSQVVYGQAGIFLFSKGEQSRWNKFERLFVGK